MKIEDTLQVTAASDSKQDKVLPNGISEAISGKTILVGIGNHLRGDDMAGALFIESIAGKVSINCINAGSVPENYLERITDFNPEKVVFIDAADFEGMPGEIRLFTPEDIRNGFCTTHTGSMTMITSYLRNRITGVEIHFIAIQPHTLEFNAPLSSSVRRAIDTLADFLLKGFPHA